MVKIVKTKAGDFQLKIITESVGALLKSVPFKSETEAKSVLEQTLRNPIFERKTNHEGKFLISLKTKNGQSVGLSQTYSSEAGMENGIKNLKKSLTENLS